MAKVILGNIYSNIEDISPKGLATVDNVLAVDTPGYKFSSAYKSGRWDGKTRFLKKTKKTIKFPTGLLHPLVTELRRIGEQVTIEDNRREVDAIIPDEIVLWDGDSTITLRDYQYNAAKSAIEATRGVINIATNGGKCVTKDTLILTAQGYKTVSDIFAENGTPCENACKSISTKVALVNRYGKLENTSHITFNGTKRVRKITLSTGIEMTNTLNHPVLTINEQGDMEWKNTENLSLGDIVVTRIGDEVYGGDTDITSTEEAYMLGALTADGYLGDYSKVSFTNNQIELLEGMETYFNRLSPKRVYKEHNDRSPGSISLCMSGVEPIKVWKDRTFIGSGTAKDKRVPKTIMQAPRDIQLAYLSGYFECECSIDVNRPRIEVTSASKVLLQQVQVMLKNMGVLSTLNPKKAKNCPNNQYSRLTIFSISTEKLLNLLSYRSSDRIEQVRKAMEKIGSCKPRPSKDNLPRGKELLSLYKDSYANPPSGMKRKMYVPDTISRSKVRTLVEEYPNGESSILSKITQLLDPRLYFDTVKYIEDVGEMETFDVCMPETHSFISSSVVNHNTEIACGIMQTLLPSLQEGERIAFFTSSKEIFTQTVQRIEKRLRRKVGRIGDGYWEEDTITVVMIPTLYKYYTKPKDLPQIKKLKDLRKQVQDLVTSKDKVAFEEARNLLAEYETTQWEKINENVAKTKKFISSIAAFIGDEVHHASSTSWYDLFMELGNAYFRFGLTGTVDESNELNVRRLYGCTGRILSKVSNDFLIEKGYSAKPTIFMMTIPTKTVNTSFYPEARKLGIIENTVRNRCFVKQIVERVKSGKQCLVIVNETEHGKIVFDLLKDHIDSVEFSHGEKSSSFRESTLTALRDGELRVLIATTILDEGVDVSGINCLFLMGGGKSMRQLLQRIGRGLRKKEDGSGIEVYDALDYHNDYLVNHTMERYKTYKAEGFDVVKI